MKFQQFDEFYITIKNYIKKNFINKENVPLQC